MEVKANYKQTDVGMIPGDWDVELLGTRASFKTGPFGSALHQSDYVYGGIPVINPMHINDGRITPCAVMSVSEEVARHLTDFRIKSGEIIIGRRGDMGRCAVVDDGQAGWMCGTGSMLIRPLLDHPDFLQRVLSSPVAIKAIENASVGSTMINLNQATLSRLSVQIPPIKEQCAIATALSDMDALLDGLDRLLAKKRAIKQATMQQLLTGQTRLPGFSGEWDVTRLGDHLTFLKNGMNSRAELSYSEDVRYLHYGDIHGYSQVMLDPASVEMPCIPRAKASRLDRLQNGDLIFSDASEDIDGVGKSVEIKNATGMDLVSGLHTIAIRFNRTVLADGFKVYIQFIPRFRAHLRQLAAGTKIYATNRAHIASAELRLPSIDEQQAISALLTDMDAEITALESRRIKTRALKQAMMQELLTGRTRLI